MVVVAGAGSEETMAGGGRAGAGLGGMKGVVLVGGRIYELEMVLGVSFETCVLVFAVVFVVIVNVFVPEGLVVIAALAKLVIAEVLNDLVDSVLIDVVLTAELDDMHS